MATLDLIVTHWTESPEETETFFRMLDVQRGIRDGEVRVILTQDGEDTGGFDPERAAAACRFPCRVLRLPHGGVSRARNAGMDAADGTWVMFCDCDDCLYSVDSLRTILDALGEAGDRADIVWAPFWMEYADGLWTRVIEGRNWVFIHAKMWRLAWLREHGIRFDETLAYAEDSTFNLEATLEADVRRIARIDEPVYMWCARETSCTANPEMAARNRRHMWEARIRRPQICLGRGRPYDAETNAIRGMMDGYYELMTDDIPDGEREELERAAVYGLIRPWKDRCAASVADMNAMGVVARRSAARKRGLHPTDETEPDADAAAWPDWQAFAEWIGRMDGKFPI